MHKIYCHQTSPMKVDNRNFGAMLHTYAHMYVSTYIHMSVYGIWHTYTYIYEWIDIYILYTTHHLFCRSSIWCSSCRFCWLMASLASRTCITNFCILDENNNISLTRHTYIHVHIYHWYHISSYSCAYVCIYSIYVCTL